MLGLVDRDMVGMRVGALLGRLGVTVGLQKGVTVGDLTSKKESLKGSAW